MDHTDGLCLSHDGSGTHKAKAASYDEVRDADVFDLVEPALFVQLTWAMPTMCWPTSVGMNGTDQ